MSYDDFDVIVYKVLRYVYSCLREGTQPRIEKAQEVARCNDVYWVHVVRSMVDDGYINGPQFPPYIDKPGGARVVCDPHALGITQKGARYLTENSKMAEVKSFLGGAFEAVVKAAIESTACL